VGVGVRNQKIVLYVETVEAARHAPLSVDGIPVMVRVTGRIYALAVAPLSVQALTAPRTDRWRPAPGGVSVGHYRVTAGTLGVLVTDAVDGERVVLSNNHVLANSSTDRVERAEAGDSIYQPGRYDGGVEADRIAGLKRYVSIREWEENRVDCAVASPDRQVDVSDDILEVGRVFGWMDPQLGMAVSKSGRTTGLTSSRVVDVNATVKVDYGPFTATFSDQAVVDSPNRSFGDSGDSGSVVFTQFAGLPVAVGLLFAGSSETIVANKWRNVLDEMQVSVGDFQPPARPTGLELLGAAVGPAAVLGVIGVEESAKWTR